MRMVARGVDLDADKEELLDILARNLTQLPHANRFDWLYRQNPAGPGRAWFVYEKETGQKMGTASLFPRSMWVGDKIEVCGQVGDFAVEKGQRSLGPAVLLQRATFSPVDERLMAFCYDCPPHDAGMSTFRRLGMRQNTRMRRYARLISLERLVSNLLGGRRPPAPMVAVGNLCFRWTNLRNHSSGLEISSLQGNFGQEFSSLDERVGGGHLIRSRRRTEDLNWRYRQDPLHHYEVLMARNHGELLGYLIFIISEQDAYLVDLFGLTLPTIGPQLLDAAVEETRRRSAHSFQAYVSEYSELADVLKKSHFHYRDEAERVVAYARPGSKTCALLETNRWLFQQVDVMA